MELFEVGGCVRDEILGIPSKDIDFSVVLSGNEDEWHRMGTPDPYQIMVDRLEAMGIKIIRGNDDKPVGHEFVTARGIAPKNFPKHPGRALDFVLARKEGAYTDGRRPDSVEPGTLLDDLARRDFTMNAIAKALDGSYIDPFNGQADIDAKIIRAVGDPMDRLTEDALRAVRALRFIVTKGFAVDHYLRSAMTSKSVTDAVRDKISDERIEAEVSKMLRFNTMTSLTMFNIFWPLTEAMFAGSVSLDATMKTKGRGR